MKKNRSVRISRGAGPAGPDDTVERDPAPYFRGALPNTSLTPEERKPVVSTDENPAIVRGKE